MEDNRKKALNAALSQIERQFGKGAIMKMGDHPREAIPSVSTGSLGLDVALGIGGLPYGRVCEIYGPESSGKTTLTLQVIAEAQKQGKTCAFVFPRFTHVRVTTGRPASRTATESQRTPSEWRPWARPTS